MTLHAQSGLNPLAIKGQKTMTDAILLCRSSDSRTVLQDGPGSCMEFVSSCERVQHYRALWFLWKHFLLTSPVKKSMDNIFHNTFYQCFTSRNAIPTPFLPILCLLVCLYGFYIDIQHECDISLSNIKCVPEPFFLEKCTGFHQHRQFLCRLL